jgi:hypothetical protein
MTIWVRRDKSFPAPQRTKETRTLPHALGLAGNLTK